MLHMKYKGLYYLAKYFYSVIVAELFMSFLWYSTYNEEDYLHDYFQDFRNVKNLVEVNYAI
jgi:hypothetical protein